MQFEDVIEDSIRIAGSGIALAELLGVSPSEITRIRTGDSKLSVKTINKILEITGLVIMPAGKQDNVITALKIMSDLFIEADNKLRQE